MKKRNDEEEKKAKKRVQLLKDQDFEAYIKEVESAKNSRVLDLLKQTDDFLRQLGAKVLI